MGNSELAGIVAFVRESGIKDFHKGNMYGMYVTGGMRGKGIGKSLIPSDPESLDQLLPWSPTLPLACRVIQQQQLQLRQPSSWHMVGAV